MDPEARHTRKSPEARRDGYRAHLAADPETGIITDEKLTRAAGQENSDPAVAEEFLAAGAAGDGAGAAPGASGGSGGDNGGGGDPLAWYGDSAYGTGDLRDAIEKAGHQAVIKPKPLQAPLSRAGSPSTTSPWTSRPAWSPARPGTPPASAAPASPPSASCAAAARCGPNAPPARPAASSSCTSATTCSAPPGLTGPPTGLRKDYMAHRPNVERAVAQVATWRGRRLKLRYRGTAKNHAWLKRRTAALNLRNLTGRGLARRDGAWALAT